jgi:hypothetical protein
MVYLERRGEKRREEKSSGASVREEERKDVRTRTLEQS